MNTLRLRAAIAEDADFAYEVLERSMKGYAVATWGLWREAESRASMREDAVAGRSEVIEFGHQPVGVVRLDRHASHHQLEQLFVLPEFQRQGIGGTVLSTILDEARACGLAVRLRVLRVNPAQALYLRYGFRVVSETPERLFMESGA